MCYLLHAGGMMKKITLISLFVSVVSFCLSINLLKNQYQGPFFVDSDRSLSVAPNIQLANSKIASQSAELKRMDQAYSDSIAKLLDSLTIRRGNEEILLELVNLESNVYRHKKIDSMGKAADVEVKTAIELFNAKTKLFCEKRGIQVLFSSNNNTIVYGSGEKSDLTDELVEFIKESK